MSLVKEHAKTATILYETELRQLLIDDLEELECFLKQRQAEMTSKDQTFFAVYQDVYAQSKQRTEKSEEFEKLKS